MKDPDVRVTINLDKDVLRSLKSYAKARSVTLEEAASGILRRGLDISPKLRKVNSVCVVDLPPDSPRITSERVRQLFDEEDQDYIRRFT